MFKTIHAIKVHPRKVMFMSALSAALLSLCPSTSQTVYAADIAVSQKATFENFKASPAIKKMRAQQQAALEKTWNKFGEINSGNRVSFFIELNILSKKWFDNRNGSIRNGQILGSQAKSIKEYVNQILGGADVSEDEREFIKTYGMPKKDFIDTYESINSLLAIAMSSMPIKSEKNFVDWLLSQEFKIHGQMRKLTHHEASLIVEAMLNGDFS